MADDGTPLRFGILGAARIAPTALINPARRSTGAQVIAIAARDPQKAQAFAQKHHIDRVHDSYADLIADPEIDAIYNPLPNSLHAEWSIRALEAGKHVLCEKPIASNATEARQMAAAADRAGNVLMEAFHYRYHPLTVRAIEIVQGGELGQIHRIETTMCIPVRRLKDIRWDYELAGGALMDAGCYTIHLLRTLAGAQPKVIKAQAWLRSPQVDRVVKADFSFDSGMSGHIHCSMLSPTLINLGAKVVGENGQLTIRNPFVPQIYHRLSVRTGKGTRHENFGKKASYDYQLAAFIAAVRNGAPFPTNMGDAIANMRVIDAVYKAAGLKLRGT